MKASLAEIDLLIRNGNLTLARRGLRRLVTKASIRPATALQVATLARRAALSDLAIQVLNPIVRPPLGRPSHASEGELAEYAANLTNIGASEEAFGILDSLDETKRPEINLYKGFSLIARWKYRESIPLFQSYLESPRISDYQRIVGRVNLASALIYERDYSRAGAHLSEVLRQTARPGMEFAHGSSLRLAAQIAIFERDWAEAARCLDRTEVTLRNTEGLDALLVRKWRAILELQKEGPSSEIQRRLAELRADALSLGHWETARSLDRFLAVRLGDHDRLLHLYFGTPFESFREKLLRDCEGGLTVPESFVWGAGHGDAHRILDLSAFALSCSAGVKAGGLLSGLLAVLASDFYRPFRVAVLHHHLYPQEYFNPISSPARVRQAIKRLRSWLAAGDFSLEIEHRPGRYWLSLEQDAVRVPKAAENSFLAATLKTLSRSFGSADFSARQAAVALEVSARTARRLLERAIREGRLSRVGSGSSTRYLVVGTGAAIGERKAA